MKTLHPFALLPLPLLLLCPARAEFNPALIPADAQWVVALDANELRSSTLGKGLMDFAQKQMTLTSGQVNQVAQGAENAMPPGFTIGNIRINFQKVTEMLGSVTAYGSNFSPDPKLIDGALVLQGTPDLRKIAEAVALQATLTMPEQVKEETGLPFPAYSIGGEVFVAFPSEPVILASKSKAQLLKARDVIRGAAPSLARASSGLAPLVANPGRSFFVAASIVPTDKLFAANAPQTRILQLVNSGMVAVGENEPNTQAQVRLVASSDDTADKLLKIVQGMVAMVSLAESTDKDLAAFLQSATVEKQGRSVSLQVAYSSERLLQLVQTINNQMKPPAPGAATIPGVPNAVAAAALPGKVLGEWNPNQAPAGSVASEALLTDHTIENVDLVNGATFTLAGRRDRAGFAVFDSVDITPMNGTGTPLHFEAENMRLRGYRIQAAPYASRGRFISLNGSFGTAQFDFPGEDGSYRIKVRYLEQPPGKTTMSVTVKNPDPLPEAK